MKRLAIATILLLFSSLPVFSISFDSLPNYQDEGMKLYIRGTGKLQEQDFVGAISDLKRAVKLRPDIPEAFHNLGFAFERTGNLQMAAKAYSKALQIKPSYPSALNNLGFLLATTESDVKQAIALCQKAVELQPDSASFRDSLGWALYKAGRFDEAVSNYKAAIKLDSGFFKPYFNIGLVELGRNNFAVAAEMFKNVVRLNKGYLKAYVSLASCYEKLNKDSQALYVYRQAANLVSETDPVKSYIDRKVKELSNETRNYYFSNVKQMQGSSKLQEFLNRKGRSSLAETYTPAPNPIGSNSSYTPVSISSVNALSGSDIGMAKMPVVNEKPSYRNNNLSAESTVSSAYSYTSAYPISNTSGQLTVNQERELERRYSLSRSYIDKGLVNEAEAELKRILQAAPKGSTVARQSRTMLLKVRKMLDEKLIDRAATHIDMGKDFFRSGQYEMAENEFNKALRLDPDNAEAYKDMALLHYNRGQHQEAFEACKRAIALDRTKKEAYVVLGSLYAKKGRNEDAIKALKRVSQVSQSKDAVDELASRMISELQTEY